MNSLAGQDGSSSKAPLNPGFFRHAARASGCMPKSTPARRVQARSIMSRWCGPARAARRSSSDAKKLDEWHRRPASRSSSRRSPAAIIRAQQTRRLMLLTSSRPRRPSVAVVIRPDHGADYARPVGRLSRQPGSVDFRRSSNPAAVPGVAAFGKAIAVCGAPVYPPIELRASTSITGLGTHAYPYDGRLVMPILRHADDRAALTIARAYGVSRQPLFAMRTTALGVMVGLKLLRDGVRRIAVGNPRMSSRSSAVRLLCRLE